MAANIAGAGDDHGWRNQDRQHHRHYDGRHDRYNKAEPHAIASTTTTPALASRAAASRHYYDSIPLQLLGPDHGGVRVVIVFRCTKAN